MEFLNDFTFSLVRTGNTIGRSITVLLTSCLTGLESAVWQLTILFLFAKQTNPSQWNRRSMVQWYFLPLVFPGKRFQKFSGLMVRKEKIRFVFKIDPPRRKKWLAAPALLLGSLSLSHFLARSLSLLLFIYRLPPPIFTLVKSLVKSSAGASR